MGANVPKNEVLRLVRAWGNSYLVNVYRIETRLARARVGWGKTRKLFPRLPMPRACARGVGGIYKPLVSLCETRVCFSFSCCAISNAVSRVRVWGALRAALWQLDTSLWLVVVCGPQHRTPGER